MTDRRQSSGSVHSAVRRRIDADLAARSASRYAGLLAGWAAADTGLMPTQEDARAELVDELEVLCRALDGLATVDPDEVFPGDSFFDERWWR